MTKKNIDRRHLLTAATSFIAGAGVVGAATPFVQSWMPSARARSSGAPVRVDLSRIEKGSMVTVAWQGKPVFVLKRTTDNISNLRDESRQLELRDAESLVNNQPDYARNVLRSIRPEIFVAVGICTHLGCIPNLEQNGQLNASHGRYYCACHGSIFDLAGRVLLNVPASTNLIIPPHTYVRDDLLVIGSDAQTTF